MSPYREVLLTFSVARWMTKKHVLRSTNWELRLTVLEPYALEVIEFYQKKGFRLRKAVTG
jgi:hypothetical protein